MHKTKYKPNSNYLFECEIMVNGLQAKTIEKEIKIILQKIIKENKPDLIVLSNECQDKKEKITKLFGIIEELEFLKNGKIIHIGRLPEQWLEQLKKEMKEKEELDKKRLSHLDDCIMICVEKDDKINALIINRKGIYSISKNPPK